MKYFIKPSPMYPSEYTIECQREDGVWLSFYPSEENPNYIEYLKWVEEGNKAKEWDYNFPDRGEE